MTPGRAEIESAAKAIWNTPLPPEAGPGVSRLECEEAATAALAAAEAIRAKNAVCTPSSGDSEPAPTPSPDRVEGDQVERVARELADVESNGCFAFPDDASEPADAEQREHYRYLATAAIAALPGPDEVTVTLTREEAQCLSDRGTDAEIRWGRSKEEAFHRAWNKLDAAIEKEER